MKDTHALGSIEPVAWRMRDEPEREWNTVNRDAKVNETWVAAVGFAEVEPLYALPADYLERVRAMEAENARLREALGALSHAVCGETGFAAAVRMTSGTAYPWPALDEAEELARAALSNREDGDV